MESYEVIRAEQLYIKEYKDNVLKSFTKRLQETRDSKKRLKQLLSYRKALTHPTKNLNEMQLQYLLDTVRNRYGHTDLFDFEQIQKILIKKGISIELDKQISELRENVRHLENVIIALDKECIYKESVDEIKNIVTLLNKKDINIRVGIDTLNSNQLNDEMTNYLYNKNQTELLSSLHNFLVDSKCEGIVIGEFIQIKGIDDLAKTWTFQQVAEANNQIDEIVSFIKNAKLSTFETMLFIHKAATSFEYNNTDDKFLEVGRVLPSIFKDEKIVCSGYASFVKAVIDKLNMENILKGVLTCELVGCRLEEKDANGEIKDTAHCHNLIHIEDEKYGIKGVYVEDACWDCAKNQSKDMEDGRGFVHCLYPVSDLLHFKNKIYKQKFNKKRIHNLLYAKRRREFINPKIENIAKGIDDFHIPYAVWRNFFNSKPIPLQTYKDGLENVIKIFTRKNAAFAKVEAEREIEKSINRAKKLFTEKSKNSFYNSVKR